MQQATAQVSSLARRSCDALRSLEGVAALPGLDALTGVGSVNALRRLPKLSRRKVLRKKLCPGHSPVATLSPVVVFVVFDSISATRPAGSSSRRASKSRQDCESPCQGRPSPAGHPPLMIGYLSRRSAQPGSFRQMESALAGQKNQSRVRLQPGRCTGIGRRKRAGNHLLAFRSGGRSFRSSTFQRH